MEGTIRDCIIQYRRLLPHCQDLLNTCLSKNVEKTSEEYIMLKAYMKRLE